MSKKTYTTDINVNDAALKEFFFAPLHQTYVENVANICINSLITIVFFFGSLQQTTWFFPILLYACESWNIFTCYTRNIQDIADRLGVAAFNKCKQNVSVALVFTLWFSVQFDRAYMHTHLRAKLFRIHEISSRIHK